MIYNSLNVYGKNPKQLEDVTKLFMFVLGDYPVAEIREAFARYVKVNTVFPTPADIVQIIERGNKPPFERSVYLEICKKYADMRTSEEWEYKKDYEKFMITGEWA